MDSPDLTPTPQSTPENTAPPTEKQVWHKPRLQSFSGEELTMNYTPGPGLDGDGLNTAAGS